MNKVATAPRLTVTVGPPTYSYDICVYSIRVAVDGADLAERHLTSDDEQGIFELVTEVLAAQPQLERLDVTDAIHDALARVPSHSRFLGSNTPLTEKTEKPRKDRKFHLAPLRDLLAEPAEETDWLVEGLLPAGGVGVIGAKPKAGKSTLARNAALAVARGDDFLGLATKQGPVIYLALEEKRSEVRKHFESMGAIDDPVFIHVGAAPQDALPELLVLMELHHPVLVIIDPLFRFTRVKDTNDYAAITTALEPVVEAARTMNCCILFAHHATKADAGGGDALLGSTAIFGAVDTALMMKRRGDGLRVVFSQQRYGDDMPETVLSLNGLTGCVALDGTLADLERRDIAVKLRDLLADHQVRTETEIREAVGGNQSKLAAVLRSEVNAGTLTREGAGKRNAPFLYRLTTGTSAAVIVLDGTADAEPIPYQDELVL